MGTSESNFESEPEVVTVSKHGQATIPKKFREKLGIDAPGKVQFRETESGEVVVDRVRSPSEMRGFAARAEERTDRPATELLREKREQEREARTENVEK